jgi:hypothetical protein
MIFASLVSGDGQKRILIRRDPVGRPLGEPEKRGGINQALTKTADL